MLPLDKHKAAKRVKKTHQQNNIGNIHSYQFHKVLVLTAKRNGTFASLYATRLE